ncbi:S-adenosyl-L-methionine-dependent methyltransferase [Bisporella sp. PMI_857]|nr:S-adenosyl-L-methionine-dependent methyltransferase [Bisporella sp. PMI_857]
MAPPNIQKRIADLQHFTQILNSSVEEIIKQWSTDGKEGTKLDTGVLLPSKNSYEAHKSILGSLGKIQELVSTPSIRLIETSHQFYESRALHIAAEHRIADVVAGHEVEGVNVVEIAEKTGLDEDKLTRILRVLTSNGIFAEVTFKHFANNRISAALAGNESLRSYLMVFSICHYKVAGALPAAVRDLGKSNKVKDTAFNIAYSVEENFWDWLKVKVPGKDGSLEPRPELSYFAQAMTGIGIAGSAALVYDFPWREIGNGTVVDVGGGVGTHSMEIAKVYHDLRFVVQDRAEVVEKGVALWKKELPDYVSTEKVQFESTDFFVQQPRIGADIYLLHTILHDWPDAESVDILKVVRRSMRPKSRVLIGEMILTNPIGAITSRANGRSKFNQTDYGIYGRYSHQRDLVMMSLFNSKERTLKEFQKVVENAGLVVSKVYECRSHNCLIECRLP